MSVLGVEMEAAALRWMEVHVSSPVAVPGAAGRLKFKETRDSNALREFVAAFKKIVDEIGPSEIAVREKPLNGRMRAGAATFYMEAALLLTCELPVTFISGTTISKTLVETAGVKDVDLPAFKAAVAAARQLA